MVLVDMQDKLSLLIRFTDLEVKLISASINLCLLELFVLMLVMCHCSPARLSNLQILQYRDNHSRFSCVQAQGRVT